MLAAICCNDYIIRKAHKDDANRIYYLVQRAFSSYGNKGCSPVARETIDDIILDLEENIVLVLEYKEMIVGSLRLIADTDREFYLKRFPIHPDFQNLGFGTFLYYKAERIVQEQGGRKISLHSSIEEERLVKFYQKLGFECLDIDNENGYKRGYWQKKIAGVDDYEIMGW